MDHIVARRYSVLTQPLPIYLGQNELLTLAMGAHVLNLLQDIHLYLAQLILLQYICTVGTLSFWLCSCTD